MIIYLLITIFNVFSAPKVPITALHSPYIKKDVDHIERVQRTATRWVKGLKSLNCEERPNALKLQSLEKMRDKKRFGPDSHDRI